MIGLYSDASIYDILHTPGTAAEVDAIERIAARFLGRSTNLRVLEPACGSGRYLRVLAGRGHDATGFDIDEGMAGYAADRLQRAGLSRRARARRLDMEAFAGDLDGEPFDLAFNLINTIRHLESDAAMRRHLGEIRRVLAPDGIYLVGLSLAAPGLEQPSEDVWEGRRGACRVRQFVSYLPPESPSDRRERVLSHLTIATPSGERYADSSYWLRTYTLRQWRGVVRAGGMEIAAVVDEDGQDIEPTEPGYANFVLRTARK